MQYYKMTSENDITNQRFDYFSGRHLLRPSGCPLTAGTAPALAPAPAGDSGQPPSHPAGARQTQTAFAPVQEKS